MAEGTVFVVDDDQAVRKSLNMLFASVGLPVETFATAAEFLKVCTAQWAGCLVLDIRMPGMSGLELQRALREKQIALPVIIITGHGDVPIAVRAMKDGAVEFMEKPFSKQLLLEHVRNAIALDAGRRDQRRRILEIRGRLALLTDREREVMDLVVSGRLSKQIAADLGISKKTVDVHRARVMEKMEAESVAELVEQALAEREFSTGVDTAATPDVVTTAN